MATITIRNITEAAHRRLRIRAAENGRSMQEEVKFLIENVPSPNTPEHEKTQSDKGNWVDEMLTKMHEIGDTDLELPERHDIESSIDFSGPEFRN